MTSYRCGCAPPTYCPTHANGCARVGTPIDCDPACEQRCVADNPFQRDIDHWNRTGKCLRHFSIDIPPRFCEQCGKRWSQVIDGREGRKRRRSVTLDARATPTRRGAK